MCFLGSGRADEDQYTHMIVSSFLQKHTQYVSLLTGGYRALHEYLSDNLSYLQDHNPRQCTVCAPLYSAKVESQSSAKSGQTGDLIGIIGFLLYHIIVLLKLHLFCEYCIYWYSDFLGKISAAMRSKSAEVTGKLIEYIVNPSNSPLQERHVSSSDKIGKRYRDVAPVFSIDDDHDNVTSVEVSFLNVFLLVVQENDCRPSMTITTN